MISNEKVGMRRYREPKKKQINKRVKITTTLGDSYLDWIGVKQDNLRRLLKYFVKKYQQEKCKIKELTYKYYLVKNNEQIVKFIEDISDDDILMLVKRTEAEINKEKEIEALRQIKIINDFFPIDVNISENFELPSCSEFSPDSSKIEWI